MRLFVLLLVLYGCGGAVDTQRPVIELYGESSLTGYGLQPGESTPERLQAKMPNITVSSYAVNGTTTREMLDGADGRNMSFARQMAESKAFAVILSRGGNEAYRNIAPAVFRTDMNQAVEIAQATGKRVILVTLFLTQTQLLPAGQWGTKEFQAQLDANILVMAQVVKDVALEYHLSYVDAIQISRAMQAEGVPWLIADNAHPNAALSQRIADALVLLL